MMNAAEQELSEVNQVLREKCDFLIKENARLTWELYFARRSENSIRTQRDDIQQQFSDALELIRFWEGKYEALKANPSKVEGA